MDGSDSDQLTEESQSEFISRDEAEALELAIQERGRQIVEIFSHLGMKLDTLSAEMIAAKKHFEIARAEIIALTKEGDDC